METLDQMRERHLQVLKYGDVVMFAATDTVYGFLSACGALKPQVRIEQMDDEANVPSNIQDCRFQVQQKFQFEDKHAYDKKLEELSMDDDTLDALLPNIAGLDTAMTRSRKGGNKGRSGGSRQPASGTSETKKIASAVMERVSHADIMKLLALRREMEHEQESNVEEFKRSIGDVVMYGDTVQLLHLSSGRYLSVKKTAALVERGNLQVTLLEAPDQGSCFLVKSGYRTRSEGDRVIFGEVVSLGSLGFQGMGLCVGKRRIAEYAMLPPMSMAPEGSSGDGAPEGLQSFEVSAGPIRGRFKIIPHSLHPTLLQPQKLNGCSVISLTMGNGEQLLLVDQSGIRFQHMVEGAQLGKRAEAVPGHALWRLEPETAEWAGQPMPPGVVCRLRHLASNTLLAAGVDEEGGEKDEHKDSPRERMRMYMTPHHETTATLWKLHSFTSEPGVSANEALLRETCHVFLQHSRGMWLTLGKGLAKSDEAKAQSTVTSMGMDSCAADLAPTNMDSNVLCVHTASSELEERALMMANALFIIQDFVHRLQGECKPIRLDSWSEASTRHIHDAIVGSGVDTVFDTCWDRVSDTMEALIHATTDRTTHGEGGDDVVRSYQQLAMEMRVIDAVVESLKVLKLNVLYGSAGKQYTDMYHQGRCMVKYGERCHRFLQRVVQNSKTLQNYVAPFIEFLKADLGGPVRAADTLAAIYHDNMKQIQMIDNSILEAFIELIASTGRRAHYLNFLSRVCGTAERPVPGNQNRLSRLLLENSASVAVSACWDEAEGDWIISAVKSDESTVKVKCSELSSVRADTHCTQISDWPAAGEDDKYRLFVYYIYLLDLYRALCHGRNQISQKNLATMDEQDTLGLDFSSLMKGIQAENLPNALRTALVQVMQVLHIDREPLEAQRLPRYVRLLETEHIAKAAEAGAEGQQKSHSVAELVEFADVCHSYLTGVLEGEMSEHTRGKNALTMQVTASVDMMFRLGVIGLDSELAANLLIVLEGLLTGYDIHPPHIKNRFVDKDGNDVVMAVKSCILSTFNFVLDVQMENESAAVFDAFRRQRKQDQPVNVRQLAWAAAESEQASSEAGDAVEAFKDGRVKAKLIVGGGEKSKSAGRYIPWERKDALSKLDIFSPKCFHFDGKPNTTVVAIFELIRYEDPTLKGQAIDLVERLLSKSRKLARQLMDTQIVCNDVISAMYTRSKTLLSLLKSQTKWIASLDDDVRAEAMLKCSEAVAELTNMLTSGARIVIDSKAGARAVGAGRPKQGGNGEFELDSISDDGDLSSDSQTVVVTKEHVSLMQAMARDLDAHQVVLTFLKLPLRTKPEDDPSRMPAALEEDRRELFGLCYQFLSRFAGGSENPEADTQNRHNQKLMFAKLPLFMSHLGTRHLNVTNTLVAIFAGNSELARKLPPGMISRFVNIIVRYGGKQRARWLRFLQAVVTVDGTPIQRNQRLVLSLLDDHEERVCELFTGEEGRAERLRLMQENEHEVNLEEGKQAKGSRLNYHRVTVQLIADCCVGGNPTFVVKASGFLPICEVLTCLCAPWNTDSGVKPSTARFIKSAYCSFLRRVYLMPNTENARMAVSANSDLVWPTEEFYRSRMSVLGGPSTARSGSTSSEVQDPDEQHSPVRARAPPDEGRRDSKELSPRERMQREGECLMHTIMAEVEVALQEPSDALGAETSAAYYLAAHVMPVVAAYFRGHFFAFYANLPAGMRSAYDTTIDQLTESIRSLQKYIQDLPAEQHGFLKTWRRACRTVDATLDAIVTHTTSQEGKIPAMDVAGGGVSVARRSFSDVDSQSVADQLGNQEIQAEWRGFISELAGSINVYIDFSRYEAVEEENVDGFEVEYASLWKFARMLTGPHGSHLEGTRPKWSHAAAVHCLVQYMLEQQERVLGEWEEETLVKVLRILRAVVHMDDGVLEASAWQEGWRRTLAHERLERAVHAKETWVQDKYADLGLAELAVRYMACGVGSVAMEAMYLLNILMQEGNGGVQDVVHALLSDTPEVSSRWFAYAATAFDAYINYHQSRDPLQEGTSSKPSGRSSVQSSQETTAMVAATGSGSSGEEQDLDLTPVVTLNEARDPDTVCLEVMKLMNLMCEGLHEGNQVLLKAQPQNSTSTNFIHRAVDVLNVLQGKLHELPGPRTDRSSCPDDEALLDAYQARLSRGMVTVFRLLNEVVQGPCRENQLAMLVGCPLLLLSNRVLHYTLYDPEHLDLTDMEAHSALKCNLLSLLCGLLEGNQPGDEEVPARMTDILSTKLLDRQVQILFIIYGRTLDGDYRKDINERVREIVVKELTLFFSFCDKLDVVVVESKTWVMYREERRAGMAGRGGSAKKGLGLVGAHAAEFKKEYLGCVEVLWKGQVEKVFFPLTVECQDRNLDWQWRDRARLRLQGIEPGMRANTIQKGIELMGLITKLEDDIETDSKLLHEAPIVHWVSQQDKTSNQAAFYISVITLCALLVLLPVPPMQVGAVGSLASAPSNLLEGGAYHTIRALITLELLCCIFVMCAYLCGDVRRWWVHSWAEPASDRAFASVAIRDWLWTRLGLRSALRLMRRAHLLPGGGPQRATSILFSAASGRVAPLEGKGAEFEIPEPPNPENDRTPMWLHLFEMLLHVSTSFKFWFTVAQITFAALSFLNEFFIVFQLLIFFVEFEAGIMLMGALRVAGASLIRTATMGIIIIVLFAVFGYIFFNRPSGVPSEMDSWAGDQPACGSFYQCTFSHLIAGMMGDLSPMYTNDHGELWKYVPLAIQDSSWLQARSFFVILFFIIWGFILSNIFTGQIVDAFASIRDDKRQMDQDTNSKCLVCSIDRFVLDQESDMGFEHHVAADHNPLHYVYFLHYLRKTEPEEYRGCDAYVAGLLGGPEPHAWLPIGRALAVEQRGMSAEAEAAEATRRETEQMSRTVKTVEALVTGIRDQFEERLSGIETRLSEFADSSGAAGDSTATRPTTGARGFAPASRFSLN